MLRFGSYVRAANTEEALEVLRFRKGAKILGGGMWMRLSSRTVPCVIDLSDCGLDTIEETADEFRIGAMVSLRTLECHEALNAATCGILERAVRDIVGVQFRELATVGGSVYGRFGFSDVVCALLSLDTEVELTGVGRMPLALFCVRGYEKDVLERVIVHKRDYRAAYDCVRRTATDFPSLNVAAGYWNGDWHVAVGARPAPARLMTGSELGLFGPAPSADKLLHAAEALRALPFSSNMWGSARYRRHLAGALGIRAVCAAAGIPVPEACAAALVPAGASEEVSA